MILAIASGKGGTGKTTISVAIANAMDERLQILDCDVEEPNVHIFLKSEYTESENVYTPVPVIDKKKCNLCGQCQEVCEFNAIVLVKDKILVFNELCHGCGGCMRVCPRGAIAEVGKLLGTVETGYINNITTVKGKLNVGRPMSPPLIRAVKKHIKQDIINIIDCPPGTSCPVITAVNNADYVILVTEATPFGLHDLKLSVETIRKIGLPFGVIINRINYGTVMVDEYCKKEMIDILLKIPESMDVAKAYSKGEDILDVIPNLKVDIVSMVQEIKRGIS